VASATGPIPGVALSGGSSFGVESPMSSHRHESLQLLEQDTAEYRMPNVRLQPRRPHHRAGRRQLQLQTVLGGGHDPEFRSGSGH